MADFVTPCNGHKPDLFYRKVFIYAGFRHQGPWVPIKVKIPKWKKFFSNRCEKVLHRYNQLKALVLLNNTVTLGCYKGVTSVTESQREKDFRYV